MDGKNAAGFNYYYETVITNLVHLRRFSWTFQRNLKIYHIKPKIIYDSNGTSSQIFVHELTDVIFKALYVRF